MTHYTWQQLSTMQQAAAVALVARRARVVSASGGPLMPFNWEERVAPNLEYTLHRGFMWDAFPNWAARKAGIASIFDPRLIGAKFPSTTALR